MIQRFEAFTAGIYGIYRHIQKIERDEMERFGLKGAYTQYLLAIDHRPEGTTAAKLCEICDRNKAAVSRILSEMETAGLISRSATAYKSLLTLTAKGQQAVDYVKERCSLATALAGEGLNEEDRSTFYRTLQLISSNLQKITDEGLPHPTTLLSEGELK